MIEKKGTTSYSSQAPWSKRVGLIHCTAKVTSCSSSKIFLWADSTSVGIN